MARSARKEREIQDREGNILKICRQILLQDGYSGLSMDRIADEMGYSKGTIYLHFKSKEDVLAAVAVQTHRRRIEFFEKAATFKGKPRERLLAISVALDLFLRLFPAHFRAEQIILLTGDPDQLEGERLRQCYQHENRCLEIVSGIVRDGIASGDLELPEHLDLETLTFGMWSVSFGAHYIGKTLGRFKDLQIERGIYSALSSALRAYLDGANFQPFTKDWDYEATEERVRSEIFAEESILAQGL
ncbi:MAG: AcrR family transcriptional regulator [Planctomycetota bacterium]|jgi:AcrR family transcriptional regulator